MIAIAKSVKIVSCKQVPALTGTYYIVVDETKNTFVLCKKNRTNLIVDKKIRLLKKGLEIMVAM